MFCSLIIRDESINRVNGITKNSIMLFLTQISNHLFLILKLPSLENFCILLKRFLVKISLLFPSESGVLFHLINKEEYYFSSSVYSMRTEKLNMFLNNP